jgi:hypothetical protein
MNARNEAYRFDQIEALRRVCSADSKLSSKDIEFGSSLCDQYFSRTYLSEKQWYWVGELLKKAGDSSGTSSASSDIKEIFDGKKIHQLLSTASRRLKYPRLRYQTDGRSKIVFCYAADNTSKWYGCVFIDNGGKENKKRYGFIASNGAGSINRDAPPEIKALIRKIADEPTGIAKLQGQAYSSCCFCGLELTNKSSIHHGYGPICADNWGLPWGDTGDQADEEAAAASELKHIQLQDLE